MALSLGFGVLFVTVIALGIVPAVYMVIEDAKRGVQWLRGLAQDDEAHARQARSVASSSGK